MKKIYKIYFLNVLLAASSTLVASGVIDLLVSADAQNVKFITVRSAHTFFLRLTCTNCQNAFPKAVGVSSDMVVEGIRGASANVQLKCKGCDRKHEIMLRPHLPANGWSAHSSEEWQRLATFEIRGMEAVESEVRDGFIVEAMDGTKYEDVDLSDDWMDVDEKGLPVSINVFKMKFGTHSAEKKRR